MNQQIITIADKRLLRLAEFAKSMGLHVRTVQLWVRRHELPVIRVGNQMLLDQIRQLLHDKGLDL